MGAYRQRDSSSDSPLAYDYSVAVQRQRRTMKVWTVVLGVAAVVYVALCIVTGAEWPW